MLAIYAKCFILDVWQGCEHAFGLVLNTVIKLEKQPNVKSSRKRCCKKLLRIRKNVLILTQENCTSAKVLVSENLKDTHREKPSNNEKLGIL